MDRIPTQKNQRSILMLPWLAHGHISSFLELAKRLSQRNFTIFFCSTPINLNALQVRETTVPSIKLIDLHLPHFRQLRPHYHTTKDLPPHLMPLLKIAFDAAKPSFTELLKTLKPDIVIYDFLQPWTLSAASEQGIPAHLFLTCGGAACSFMTHYGISSSTPYPFPALIFPDDESRKIIGFMDHIANGITNGARYVNCILGSSNIILIKTSTEIESKYIDHLHELTGKRIVAVGPLIQEQENNDNSGSSAIMSWLSEKEPSSVVFVSFGSEYFPSRGEIEEIALGLELSGVGFIWAVRFHAEDRPCTLDEALPEGFLQRTQNRGMVIENWAPQAKILKHSSIGGFISHCGWSSTLEAIMSGVPIIAMPMHLDQPLNAKLAVQIGVAMEVMKKDGKFSREEVSRVIKELVVEERGKEMRRKAEELGKKMKQRGEEEVDAAAEMIQGIIGI